MTMKEAIGTVVCKPFAGSNVIQPAVELDDGTWYWISQPRDAKAWPADPGQRVRVRYAFGDQFCQVVEEVTEVVPMRSLVGKHVILDGRKEKIVDAGEERADDKGYRVIRVEMASGKVCDLLVPVETLD
jgi:hypothetical protein